MKLGFSLSHFSIVLSSVGFFICFPAFADSVQSIEVKGNKRIESETVLSYLHLGKGSSYDQTHIDQALNSLYATGYFSDVQIKHQNGKIRIDVIENAIVNKIVFEGNNKIKEDQLQEEVQLRPREILSRAKIKIARQRILDLYRRMGRYGVTVEPKVIKLNDNRLNLVFEIKEGEVTYVRKIHFLGNKHINSDKLEKALLTKKARWYRFFASDDTYDPERFLADQQLLRQYYYDNGYPDFRLVSAVAELSVDQKDLYITFSVEEGNLYHFGKIDVQSTLSRFPADLFKQQISFSSSDAYSAQKIEKTITKMTEMANINGFSFIEIDPIIQKNKETKTIDLTFHVKEGPRIYIERIDIRGNERTRDQVIRREIRLHEGDAYNSVFVKRAEQNLNDLGYFKKVEILNEQGSSPDKTIIVIKVEEQPTGELGISGGFSSLDKALGNIHFTERNLMGAGRSVSINTTIAMRRQDFDVGITEPYLFGYNLEGGANAFHTRLSRLSQFKQQSTGTRFHVFYELAENWYQNLSYGIRRDIVFDVSDKASKYIKDQAGKYIDSSLSQALTYERRNSRKDPTSGYSITLTNSYSGIGGNVKYLHNKISGNVYYTPLDDITVSTRATAGNVMKTSSQSIRLVDRVFLGNETFRGFSYGGLGPRDKKTKDPLGGTLYYVATIEALIPIGLPNEFGIKGALFTDVGAVWKTGETGETNVQDSKTPRVSVGMGIIWKSPVGPLRFDWSTPIKQDSLDETETFLFGVSSRF